MIRGFPPIVSDVSRALILGSMPGKASLDAGEYYAHPRNAFWSIMGDLFGAGPSLPYDARAAALEQAGVALWDALQLCTRAGSLDSAITDEVANDFPAFFARYPTIARVYFNGAKAEAAFRRHSLPTLRGARLIFMRLPSTSPAHAGMSLNAKVEAWRVIASACGRPVSVRP